MTVSNSDKPVQVYSLCSARPDQLFSPFCWAAKLAVAHKGLPVDIVPWKFTENDAIAFSGQDKVPVIVDGDNVVADSWKIAEYLENTYPDRPSLFGGPEAKAAIYFIRCWAVSLAGGMLKQVVVDIRDSLDEPAKSYFTETREKMLGCKLEEFCADRDERLPEYRDSFKPLRMMLENQKFIGGDAPNFGDYAVFGSFMTAANFREILEKDDPVYAWRETLMDKFDGLARKHLP